MSKSNDATGWYGHVFKAWQAKALGPKPTAAQLDNIHKLGARAGKQALACAMALRDCGVTGSQIVQACGAPQLNKMRGFITDNLLKREAVPPNNVGHTVYKLTVTAKGLTRIKGAAAKADAADKPAKAKPAKVSKPRKAKAEPKPEPVTEPVAAEPVQADQPQA